MSISQHRSIAQIIIFPLSFLLGWVTLQIPVYCQTCHLPSGVGCQGGQIVDLSLVACSISGTLNCSNTVKPPTCHFQKLKSIFKIVVPGLLYQHMLFCILHSLYLVGCPFCSKALGDTPLGSKVPWSSTHPVSSTVRKQAVTTNRSMIIVVSSLRINIYTFGSAFQDCLFGTQIRFFILPFPRKSRNSPHGLQFYEECSPVCSNQQQ